MAKRVRHYMANIVPLTVSLDTPMIEVISRLMGTMYHVAVVLDSDKHLQGIITGTDIVREIERRTDSPALLEGNAQLVMTPDVTIVSERMFMLDAVEIMFRKRLHTLVVTEDGGRTKAIGIITQVHIMTWWMDEFGLPSEDETQ